VLLFNDMSNRDLMCGRRRQENDGDAESASASYVGDIDRYIRLLATGG
jgi:hypothetical protein